MRNWSWYQSKQAVDWQQRFEKRKTLFTFSLYLPQEKPFGTLEEEK